MSWKARRATAAKKQTPERIFAALSAAVVSSSSSLSILRVAACEGLSGELVAVMGWVGGES